MTWTTRTTNKATDLRITQAYLDGRTDRAELHGYDKAKWIEFAETMLRCGYEVILYEARNTFSKYLTVWNGSLSYKVRFSNHKPIRHREEAGDCDFFVGRTNFNVTTTNQAIIATIAYLD